MRRNESPTVAGKAGLHSFRNAPYPDGDVTTAGERDRESRELAVELKGRLWQSLSPRDIRHHAEALPLLTPAAFRYYIPAYMIACVDARPLIDVAWDSVIFNLTPPKKRAGERWESFQSRVSGFDQEQIDAIVAFVRFLREQEREDWRAIGKDPPDDRVLPSVEYWEARVQKKLP